MTRRFGIDTSVLVRLLTGEPEADFALCVRKLRSLIEEDGAEILVSNQVIGEAYIAVQHHYGVSRDDARAGLLDVPRSGRTAERPHGIGRHGGPGVRVSSTDSSPTTTPAPGWQR